MGKSELINRERLKEIINASNYCKHLEREWEILGWNKLSEDSDDSQLCMKIDLLEILAVIYEQGHSGFSFNYMFNLLTRLANFLPISPLTGEDDEWHEMLDGCLQNIRCSIVFKDKDGKAYNTNGYVFESVDGGCYISIKSRKYITFPYFPPTKPIYKKEPWYYFKLLKKKLVDLFKKPEKALDN